MSYLIHSLGLTDKIVKDIFERLVAYCAPQKIQIIEQLKFFQHELLSGETFGNFLIMLRKPAKCTYFI